MAQELVPLTAEAKAHTHPLGRTRATLALSPSGDDSPAQSSPAEGAFGLRPQDLHSGYSLPADAADAPTIAIVDAYNDLDAEADLATYSREFGLPECTEADGCFEKVGQSGQASSLPFPQTSEQLGNEEARCRAGRSQACFKISEAEGWALEISLDIETAHAVCQNCHIALVEAGSDSFADLEAAENSAVGLGAAVVSDSWAGPECREGTCLEESSAFNHPRTVIAAAAGDEGFLNWLEEPRASYADFPAASPHVVAVGGTRLLLGAKGEWEDETVWNDGGESEGAKDGFGAGGGGCSLQFEAPQWQRSLPNWSAVGCEEDHRAVADVSADADPYTGLAVYDTFGFECETAFRENNKVVTLRWCTIGGTSLATPLIASTFALAGGANGVEYPARTLYEKESAVPTSLHDVTSGSNGECLQPFDEAAGTQPCTPAEEAQRSCESHAICLAGPGYDGPSGVGTPDGIDAFQPPPQAPTVVTGTASAITQTAATLNATVNADGHEVSECKLEYGLHTVSEASVPCTPSPGSGSSAVAVSGAATGLTPGTTYSFRVVASNSGGTSEGEARSFTTFAAGEPPTIERESAAHITDDDATLEATIDTHDLQTEYKVLFEDPCPVPRECVRADVQVAHGVLAPDAEGQLVSVDLAHASGNPTVEPDTTYGYLVIARSAAGETTTPTQTFQTLPEPKLPTTLQQLTPGEGTSDSTQTGSGTQTTASQAVAGSQTHKTPSIPDARLASSALIASRSGIVTVKISCPAGESACAGTVTLRTSSAHGTGARRSRKHAPTTITLAVAPFGVAGGRVTTVKLYLSARARALLAHAHTLRAQATVFARDPAGATHTTRSAVTIREKRDGA